MEQLYILQKGLTETALRDSTKTWIMDSGLDHGLDSIMDSIFGQDSNIDCEDTYTQQQILDAISLNHSSSTTF